MKLTRLVTQFSSGTRHTNATKARLTRFMICTNYMIAAYCTHLKALKIHYRSHPLYYSRLKV